MIHIHPKFVKANDHVDLWDIGPKVPTAPVVPEQPDAKLKGAELALAQIHYEDAMEDYKLALRRWGKDKADYAAWRREFGGPIKIDMWSTDAKHALEVDPERYFLELPKGIKPGKAQADADEAAAMSVAELNEAREKDPQFGKGTSR